MTTYHVWLVDQVEPEVVRAEGLLLRDSALLFYDLSTVKRSYQPHEWHRWTVVHDEADTAHI